jgi:hypothetical protein
MNYVVVRVQCAHRYERVGSTMHTLRYGHVYLMVAARARMLIASGDAKFFPY